LCRHWWSGGPDGERGVDVGCFPQEKNSNSYADPLGYGSIEEEKREAMTRQLTAIIEKENDGYVALCPEVDVASQGSSVAEARTNVKEALDLFFETASADEIRERLHGEVYVTQVEVAIG